VLQGDSNPARVDLSLLKAVARARRWADELVSGKVRSVSDLARREGIDGRSVRRLIPLGFLSPRIIEAIAEGRQPVELTVEALTRRIDLPLLWSAQEQALGMKSVGDVDSSIASRRRYQPAIGARALR
jgi:site-specific DNA recombinase